MLRNLLLATSLFGSVLVGCSVGAQDPSAPTSELRVIKTCLRTVCQQRVSDETDACIRCTDACSSASYDCDPSTACSLSCDTPSDCSDYENNTCADEGFKAVLPDNPSKDVRAACDREVAFVEACGYTLKAPCASYAAVEKPSVAAQYDCVTQLSCGDLQNADALATCDLPPTTLGDDLCGALSACGSSCSDDERTQLDREGAWLRDDAIKAGRDCLTQDKCSDARQCVTAWESGIGMN